MKKYVSLVLTVLMCCIISVSVFAENEDLTDFENENPIITVTEDETVQQTATPASDNTNNRLVMQNPTLGGEIGGQGGVQNLVPQGEDPRPTPDNPNPESPTLPVPPGSIDSDEYKRPQPDPYPGQASSIISDGTVWIIVAVTVLAVAVFTAVLIYKKKKKI